MSLKNNAKFSVSINPERGYQEVYIKSFSDGEECSRLIYIKTNPKYKEMDYIREAKKQLEPNHEIKPNAKPLSRFPVIPIVASLVIAGGLGAGGYFIYKYLNNANAGDWAKADLAMDAAVEKVDKFNEELTGIRFHISSLVINDQGTKWSISYCFFSRGFPE